MLPDPEESIAALLEGDEPPWDDDPETPGDEHRANQMLARIGRLEGELAHAAEIAERQARQLQEWLAEQTEPREKQLGWLRTALEDYQRRVYATTQLATISLPAGDLASTKAQPDWIFDDEAAFLDWAIENAPSAIRRKAPEIDKVEAKRLLTRRDARGNPVAFGFDEKGLRPPGLQIFEHEQADRHYHQKPRH